MSGRQRTIQVAIIAWAVIGAAVAWSAIGDVNDDARLFVGAASTLGPVLALCAAAALKRAGGRVSAALLTASAIVTPTYFAWPLNAAVLIAAAVLALRPQRTGTPSAQA